MPSHVMPQDENFLSFDEIFEELDPTNLNIKEREFLSDSRRATTDEKVRIRRAEFLLKLTA